MKRRKSMIALGLAVVMAVMPMTSYGFPILGKKAEETTEIKYEFKSGDTTITIGAEAAGILAALGAPKSTFEQTSCAYQGTDKVYSYDGFEVSTYPVNKKECICSVYIADPTGKVATPEGIKCGSTKQNVLDTYGKNYDADEAKFGTYTYTDTAGTMKLKVYTTKDVVDAIEYIVIPAK